MSCTRKPTKCDRDRRDNVWVEGEVDEHGEGGVCLLDTLDIASVTQIVQRDEVARQDLYRVTSDPELLSIAENAPPLPKQEPEDVLQKALNANSIPYYTIFRGNPPYAQ